MKKRKEKKIIGTKKVGEGGKGKGSGENDEGKWMIEGLRGERIEGRRRRKEVRR